MATTVQDGNNGLFLLTCAGVDLCCICSDGSGWDHFSVTLGNKARCPTWAEMDFVRKQFFRDDETVVQFHVPERVHVNFHEFCLHLWRPQDDKIPLPPPSLVGFRDMDQGKGNPQDQEYFLTVTISKIVARKILEIAGQRNESPEEIAAFLLREALLSQLGR